jgi:methylglutaconyl-CoA hydratase
MRSKRLAMDYQHLLIDKREQTATVRLNRPVLHNAFNEQLIAELTHAFRTFGADDSVRIILLAAEGKSFCAGADLNWMGAMVNYSREQNVQDASAMADMFEAIDACPKPVIARVHGAAMGGGIGLVAACDLAFTVPEAKFAFSEVKLGIIPAVISPYVVRKIGYGHARALFLTGERFDAETAFRIGLLHRILPAGELDAGIQASINAMLRNGPQAMAAVKSLLREIAEHSQDEVRELTIRQIADLRVSPEGQEGIRAFLEKREPGF